VEARRTEIKLSSGTLPYAEFGEGRPLLYLHAAGGPQISRFLENLAKTHRVYMPTAPGFEGAPVHDTVRNMPDLAKLYGEFADKVIKAPCDAVAPKDETIPETTGHVLKEKIPLSRLTYMYDAAHGIENVGGAA
jgi:hypothetical protein